MSHKKIALAMILGDDKSQEQVEKCFKSVEPFVDHIFVSYNGSSTDGFPYYNPTECDFTFEHCEWTDEFDVARNKSFDMVNNSGINFDWIMWMDADDIIVGGENLQKVVGGVKPETDVILCVYEYGYDFEKDIVLTTQKRERLLRFGKQWQWTSPIHEVIASEFGTQLARCEEVKFRHLSGIEDKVGVRSRNRRILMKALQKTPNEPRLIYYLANEIYHEALLRHVEKPEDAFPLFDEAKGYFRKFVDTNPNPDDSYVATHRIADSLRLSRKFSLAIDEEFQNIKMMPSWPESWVGIAQCWLEVGQWANAEKFADFVIEYILPTLGNRETVQVVEPMTEKYTPWLIRGIARENQGKIEEALVDFETAKSNLPINDTQIDVHIDRIKKRLNGSVPVVTNVDSRKKLFGSKSDNSIAFVVPPTAEPWHPRYIDRLGSGGAEHCVIKIAEKFAEDGRRVAVFGTPGEYEGVDDASGVEYWPLTEFVSNEKFNTVVSSRWPMIFENDVNANNKILWMHDVNCGPGSDESPKGNRYNLPDAVITLTNWHKNYLKKLFEVDESRSFVVGNGVDLSSFKNIDYNRPLGDKIIYASSPDRGLSTLLDYWPSIRSINPNAELHIFYGWAGIDKMIALGHTGLKVFKDSIVSKYDDLGRDSGGIIWHDRVPRDQLIGESASMGIWAYPTQFCETFCITAIEQQLAGVIPITSDLAALSEVVGNKSDLIYGWPNNSAYKSLWLDKYQEILSMSTSSIIDKRHKNIEHATQFTWDEAFKQWEDVIAKVSK